MKDACFLKLTTFAKCFSTDIPFTKDEDEERRMREWSEGEQNHCGTVSLGQFNVVSHLDLIHQDTTNAWFAILELIPTLFTVISPFHLVLFYPFHSFSVFLENKVSFFFQTGRDSTLSLIFLCPISHCPYCFPCPPCSISVFCAPQLLCFP